MVTSIFKSLSLIIFAVLLPLTAWVTYSVSYQYLVGKELTSVRSQLGLFASDLEAEIEKYSFLPRVLSRNQKFKDLLSKHDASQNMLSNINRDLAYINTVSNTEVVYLMRLDGTTVAASNWDAEDSFVGENFTFRPYFQNAIAGREGRYFALGTTSGRRGYYFSAPVQTNANKPPIGIVVVKVNIDKLEQSWQDYAMTFLVTDTNGVVFSSNNPKWRFRTLHPLSKDALLDIRNNQQYPVDILKQTTLVPSKSYPGLLSIDLSDRLEQFLSAQQAIPTLNWNVYALKPASGLKKAALGYAAFAALLAVLSWGLVYLSSLRRYNLREKLELKQRSERQLKEAHDKLEQRVVQRTHALSESNKILKQEITDRRFAEDELRRTQKELIHAAKLATLGQLASGITHELNQPLAAINNYAENAQKFLSQNNSEQTRSNLFEILKLSERMSDITTQLKTYSYKTDDQIGATDLNKCIHNALAIIKSRIKASKTSVSFELLSDAQVYANDIRLEQVFINLFGNALDAMQDSDHRLIKLKQTAKEGWISTRVIDSGPGIEKSQLPHIFDAFFTTKTVGVGLGLGLSISSEIIQNLGGRLRASNHASGGAQFEILLRSTTET